MSHVSLLDDARLARRIGAHFVSLIVPVTATILVVVWSVACLSPIYVNNRTPPLSVVNERDAEGVGEKLAYSVVSALMVVAGIVAATFGIVVLYHFRLHFVLYGWLAFSAASMFFVLVWVWLDLFCTYFQIPYNALSMALFVWNFGVVGLITLFYYSHSAVTQGYLVIASILIAWSLTALPEWTTWTFLMCIASYDIVAVLWRQGPLHRLIEVAHERDEPIPGFIYDSAHGVTPITRAPIDSSEGTANPTARSPPPQGGTAPRTSTALRAEPFKLGIGDFVFYSLLVGRASYSGFVSWSFCLVGILSGMVGTLLSLQLLRDSHRALPALPFSIFLSIFVFALCELLVAPLGAFVSRNLLLL